MKVEAKLKQLSGFILERGTWVRLDMKCEKELLTNWNSITSLPFSAGLPSAMTVEHKRNRAWLATSSLQTHIQFKDSSQ